MFTILENSPAKTSLQNVRRDIAASAAHAGGSQADRIIPRPKDESWTSILQNIRQYLPIQNPLTAFLHNNMLMAWEYAPFWQAVQQAASLYGAHVPWTIHRYHDEFKKRRIVHDALVQAISNQFEEVDIWLARSPHQIKWAHWIAALMEKGPATPACHLLDADPSFRTANSDRNNEKSDRWTIIEKLDEASKSLEEILPISVQEWLCHCLESFLDQGIARWHNPFQNRGLLEFIQTTETISLNIRHPWQKRLARRLRRLRWQSSDEIERLRLASGLDAVAFQQVCLNLLFTVKGWSGMFNKAETNPETMPLTTPAAHLDDLILVLLLLRQSIGLPLAPLAKPWHLARQRQSKCDLDRDQITNIISQISSSPISSIEDQDLKKFIDATNALDETQCRIIWHNAFEASLYATTINSLTTHQTKSRGKHQLSEAANQGVPPLILCCIDDREESLRRHIERLEPKARTYGVLGHFGLDMKFMSLHGHKPSIQCPPVVVARRTVYEELAAVRRSKKDQELARKQIKTWKSASFAASQTILWGYFISLFLGIFTAIPLFLRVIAPRQTNRLTLAIKKLFSGKQPSQLQINRHEHPVYGACGYTIEEQADIVKSVIEGILPISSWPSVILALAHESTSANNPFEKAYGCGACSGNSGGINARTFALMANDLQVRARLKTLGIDLPSDSVFVGAVHDTTRDSVAYYTSDCQLTLEQQQVLKEVSSLIDHALKENAYERSHLLRGDVATTPNKARSHMLARSVSLAEPRPEYGHTRTFMAVIGRRELTKGLSLDRRSFLISYSPSDDANGEILSKLIHGAMPVVANITLDYLFSSLDNHAFGAGTKLPINVSALLGIVTGSRGDLRIGLSQQMIEMHEPSRAIVFVEATHTKIEAAVFSHPRPRQLVQNGWIRLAAIDPDSAKCTIWTTIGWQEPNCRFAGLPDCLLDWAEKSGMVADARRVAIKRTQQGGVR